MGLSFFNQRRAKEIEKKASIDSAETLINAKDDASLPCQEEEGLSLDPQPIEDAQIVEEVEETKTVEETTEPTKEPKISDAQKIKNAKNKNAKK